MTTLDRGHLDAETIATLAEGTGELADRETVVRHLASCGTCMAAYADAVRDRAAWLADPERFSSSVELVRLGLDASAAGREALPGPGVASLKHWDEASGAGVGSTFAATDTTVSLARPTSRTALPGLRWAAAAAGVIVAGILVWAAWSPGRRSESLVPAALARGLESCAAGGLVLPGGEAGAVRRAPTLRAGTPDSVPGLAELVARLQSEYESGQRDAQTAYSLAAGLLALGQYEAARGYLEESRRDAPQDFRLTLLAADIAYRASNLATAESELRKALQIRPSSPIARLDLALVLAERGQRAEAAELLDRLARESSGAIRERARRERASLAP